MTNWKISFKGEKGEDVRLFLRQMEEMMQSSGLIDDEIAWGFSILWTKAREQIPAWTHISSIHERISKRTRWKIAPMNYIRNWKQTKRKRENKTKNGSVGEYINTVRFIFDEVDEPEMQECALQISVTRTHEKLHEYLHRKSKRSR